MLNSPPVFWFITLARESALFSSSAGSGENKFMVSCAETLVFRTGPWKVSSQAVLIPANRFKSLGLPQF